MKAALAAGMRVVWVPHPDLAWYYGINSKLAFLYFFHHSSRYCQENSKSILLHGYLSTHSKRAQKTWPMIKNSRSETRFSQRQISRFLVYRSVSI